MRLPDRTEGRPNIENKRLRKHFIETLHPMYLWHGFIYTDDTHPHTHSHTHACAHTHRLWLTDQHVWETLILKMTCSFPFLPEEKRRESGSSNPPLVGVAEMFSISISKVEWMSRTANIKKLKRYIKQKLYNNNNNNNSILYTATWPHCIEKQINDDQLFKLF